MPSSGTWRRVDLVRADVSEERITSIFRVEKSGPVREANHLSLIAKVKNDAAIPPLPMAW
jgi:hypothetical protein